MVLCQVTNFMLALLDLKIAANDMDKIVTISIVVSSTLLLVRIRQVKVKLN